MKIRYGSFAPRTLHLRQSQKPSTADLCLLWPDKLDLVAYVGRCRLSVPDDILGILCNCPLGFTHCSFLSFLPFRPSDKDFDSTTLYLGEMTISRYTIKPL